MTSMYLGLLTLVLCFGLPVAMVYMQTKWGRREGFTGEYNQFRKCTACEWADQAPTTQRDRHICPICGASTQVAVGRWVLGATGPIRFEERHT